MAEKRESEEKPWEKLAPGNAGHHHLTPAEKTEAKERALKAGRHYPNLVDNMAVTRKAHDT